MATATQSKNGQSPPPPAPDGTPGAYTAPPDWAPQQPAQTQQPSPEATAVAQQQADQYKAEGQKPTPVWSATPQLPQQQPQADQTQQPVQQPTQQPAAEQQQKAKGGFTAPDTDQATSDFGGKSFTNFTAPQQDQETTEQSGPFVSHETPLAATDDELNKLDTNTLISRLTNYSDVDSVRGAAILHDRLQKDAANTSPAQGGAMLANDLTNTLSKISVNPVDWARGLVGFKNTLGGAADTFMQSMGAQNTANYRDDLAQQLKQGTVTKDQYTQGMALLDQIDNTKAKRAMLGPGGGLGETAEHEQELGDEQSNITRMFFQADSNFAKTQASKALATVLTGTEHSLQAIAALPNQISDFDPVKYLTGASKMTGWSPEQLKDWINFERFFNVSRQEHAQGGVDPWTQSFSKWSGDRLKDAGLWDRNANTAAPSEVDPTKVDQISQAATLLEQEAMGRILPVGEIGSGLSQAWLKSAGLATKAVPPVARFAERAVSSKIGRFITSPIQLALFYPELAHGHIGTIAWDAAKEGLTYGALRVIDKYGPLAADMFERAADNNFKGGGFFSQGLSRGLRLGADSVANSFPYALLNSGGDPGQFWNNLTTLSAFHGLAGAPKAALDTVAGGAGDWLWARDGKVKEVPARPFNTDPDLSAENIANINNLDPHLKNIMTRTQDAVADHTDMFVVSPQTMQDYQQRFGATAQQMPRGFWVPPEYTGTGKSAAFIDANHVSEASAHEAMGHPLYWLMDQADRDTVADAAIKENDPDQFIKDNYGQNATYDSLPDHPSRANPSALSKDLIRTEMAVESIGRYWNGGSIEQFYKDKPSLSRALRNSVGPVLERLGIPTSTWESTSTMGINPAFAPSTLIDGYYRDLINHRIVRTNVPTNSLGRWPQKGETVTPGGAQPQQPTPRPQQSGQAAIQARAYQISQIRQAKGLPGDATSDWLQAEAELGGPQPQQPKPQQPTPGPTADTHPADTEAHHTTIEEAIEKGTPAGQAQAQAEGKKGQTLAETGEEPGFMPTTRLKAQPKPTKVVGPPVQPSALNPLARVTGTGAGRNLPPPAPAETPAPRAELVSQPQTETTDQAAEKTSQEAALTPTGKATVTAPEAPGAKVAPKTTTEPQKSVQQAPATAKVGPTAPVTPQKPTKEGKYVGVVGSEFGEVDNPARGGYTEPDWNKGKWGDDISGENNRGVALPSSILRHLGYTDQKGYGQLFNSRYEVRIHNPKTGATTTASLKDLGPGASTGALIDMLWGTRKDLGFDTNFKGAVNFEIVDKKTGEVAYQPTGKEIDEGGGGPIGKGGGGGGAGGAGGGGGPIIGGEAGTPFTFPETQAPAKLGAEVPAMNVEPPAFTGGGGESGGGGGGGTFAGERMAAPVARAPIPTTLTAAHQAMQMAEMEAYGGAGPGYVPAAPGISFMPRKGGSRKATEPEGEEGEESTLGEPMPKGMEDLLPHLGQGLPGLKLAQQKHAKLLSKDDTRVRQQGSGSSTRFKGEHFVPGDPVHAAALADVPDNEKRALAAGQTAIQNRQPMHMTYLSAPPARETPISRQSRRVDYDESSPEARLMGTTQGRLAGHSVIPLSIGISTPRKKGEPNRGYIEGISTSAAAHNHALINEALGMMGEPSPYPELRSPKFRNDFRGYIQNLMAGHTGTGNKYQVGTEDYPVSPDKNYVPYRLKQKEADFMNAILNNQRARTTPAVRKLAQKGGTLLSEEGEVNPMRQAIDRAEIEDPSLKYAANERWSKHVLEPTIRTFKAGLIKSLHEKPEELPSDLRQNVMAYRKLTQTLSEEMGQKRGWPDIPTAAAFMPGAKKKPAPLSPQEHEELTGNIRKQFLSGKLRQGDYLERLGDVPEPGEEIGGPSYMPMAGPKAQKFGEAQKAGRTYETPLPGGGQRFEIDDRDMEFKPTRNQYVSVPGYGVPPKNALEERYKTDKRGPGKMPLSDAIRHPELFENYPFLRRTQISLDPTIRHSGHYEPPWVDEAGNPRGDHIVVQDPEDKRTTVHEIQHAIQHYENFAGKGTNAKHIADSMVNDTGLKDELEKIWSAAYPERSNMSDEEFAKNEQLRGKWMDKRIKEMAFAMYHSEPGEIEARVAGSRAMLHPELQNTQPKLAVLDEMREAEQEAREAGIMNPRHRGLQYGTTGTPPRSEGIAYMPGGKGEFKETKPEDFITARNKSKRPQFLSPLEPGDIQNHKLYMNDEHTAGAAVSPEGDIQNVFNNGGGKGAGQRALAHAIRNGGTHLDAYDPFLPRLYRQFGFKETGRMKFNRDYAPPNWNFEEDDDPDIAFMSHQGYPEGGEQAAIERATGPQEHWLPNERSTQLETDWDQAKDRSRGSVHQGPGETPGPETLGAGEEPRHQAGGAGRLHLGPPEAPGIAYMAAGKKGQAAAPAKISKATQKQLGPRPEDEEQGNAWDRFAARMDKQIPGAIPLRPARNKKGELKLANDNPEFEKEGGGYHLANAPMLGKRALGYDKKGTVNKAPEGTVDTIDPGDLTYLTPADRLRISHLDKNGAIDMYADALHKEYNRIEKDVPAALNAKDWYNDTEGYLKDHFPEPGHPDLAANLLAATSPRTFVKTNYGFAMNAMHRYLRGDYDRHIKLYQKAYQLKQAGELMNHVSGLTDPKTGQNYEPTSDANAMASYIIHHDILPTQHDINDPTKKGPQYGMHSDAVLRVLAGHWLDQLEGPKTRRYTGNLSGRDIQSTGDMWVARELRRLGFEGHTKEPWLVQPPAESGLSDLDFAIQELAHRRASAKRDLEPRQNQAIHWTSEILHWLKNNWATGVDPAERDYRPMLKEYERPEWAQRKAA